MKEVNKEKLSRFQMLINFEPETQIQQFLGHSLLTAVFVPGILGVAVLHP